MPDKRKVTTGKGKVSGAAYRAPLGTELPDDAITALSSDFKLLGYLADSGLINSRSVENKVIRAWCGDVVDIIPTESTDKFKFKMIEALNPDVLGTVYGDANVTSTTSKITVKAVTTAELEFVWVFEIVLKGGKIKRIVIPDASVTEVGDTEYIGNNVIGYDCTITALADTSGATHYEYIE